jgi:hypothetical protein
MHKTQSKEVSRWMSHSKHRIPYTNNYFVPIIAAWLPDMFHNFYLAKNHKIPKNSTTTEAREKNKQRYGRLII